jgi:hypothetical protein
LVKTPENGSGEDLRVQTAGEIFSDTAIELVRDPADHEGLKLVRYRQGVSEVKSEVAHAGRLYAPIHLDRSLANCVRFPARIAPPETTQELVAAVQGLLANHLAQLETCIMAMVCAIFSSWFARVRQVAPILWIVTPPGSPKNRVLQLFNLLCRRPIRLVGVRRSDLVRVPFSVEPTVLLDEPDPQPSLQAILQASGHPGAQIPSGRGIIDLFGPKIICSQKIPSGTALPSDVFRATLIPVSGQLPPLEKRAEEEIAEEYQSRFLGYFLRNFDRIQVPKFDGSKLTLPMQDIAAALGAAFTGYEKIQAKIPQLLAAQDEEIRADRACALDAVVVEAVLSFIHQAAGSKIRMEVVGEKASAIFKGRGSNKEVSAEMAGWAIKRLGIPSGRINKAANGVELTPQVCRLVHRLAVSHGVRAMQSGYRSACRYCEELDLETNKRK